MASPEGPDDSHIADTGMFKRFVAHEQEMDSIEHDGSTTGRWIAIGAIVALIVIALIVWLAVR
jgi:uncharacterized membrane protein YukC